MCTQRDRSINQTKLSMYVQYTVQLFYKKDDIKGVVIVISRDPPSKDDKATFKTVTLKLKSDQKCER